MAAVEHVVADSAAFIKNAPLREIAEEIFSIREVIAEIRDKPTRQRLQFLPYELKFREPSTESIRIVTEFSKKTGDYRSLSAVDIRVMALTYQLEKEFAGADHIKIKPDKNITWETSKRHLENPAHIAGFYLKPKNASSQSRTTSVCESITSDITGLEVKDRISGLSICDEEKEVKGETETNQTIEDSIIQMANIDNELQSSCDIAPTQPEENNTNSDLKTHPESCQNSSSSTNERQSISNKAVGDGTALQSKEAEESLTEKVGESRSGQMGDGDVLPSNCLADDVTDESDDAYSESDDEDDDDDEGWITPSNVKQMKEKMGDRNTEEARVKVACLTTDFAMQNVLIQMCLNVVSVDGLLIKRAKSYVLRCYACFKISTDTTRVFCAHCGNDTLQRVSMTVDDDGSIKYFLSARKQINNRGKKFTLPQPKGGKYSVNPILVADQKEAQQRSSKASRIKYNVMDEDYVTRSSPFAPIDTQSRAAQLGFNRWGKRRGGGGGGKQQQGRRR